MYLGHDGHAHFAIAQGSVGLVEGDFCDDATFAVSLCSGQHLEGLGEAIGLEASLRIALYCRHQDQFIERRLPVKMNLYPSRRIGLVVGA